MCVVVAGDLGTGRVDGREHERVEVCVTSLEPVFRDRQVGRGEEVEQGEVGNAEVDALEIVVEGNAVVVGDKQGGQRWRQVWWVLAVGK